MIKLTIQEKDAIRDMLDAYVKRYPSANKAVASLKGTSTGTVSAYEVQSMMTYPTICSVK